MLTYFETDIPITNAFTESINRLAKDKNRDGRGYSFEVMRARMLFTTKHKMKSPQAKEFPFLGRTTMTYSMDLLEVEENYGIDLSTLWKD
ncbi:transposase [Onishia taeanensis]|uniref:Transposase n=1 Tax=Onishia taeanensis TaxID=284577 RepID=A0A328XM92_9GAMM|nr:transposase [Halomonas taeanensis]